MNIINTIVSNYIVLVRYIHWYRHDFITSIICDVIIVSITMSITSMVALLITRTLWQLCLVTLNLRYQSLNLKKKKFMNLVSDLFFRPIR